MLGPAADSIEGVLMGLCSCLTEALCSCLSGCLDGLLLHRDASGCLCSSLAGCLAECCCGRLWCCLDGSLTKAFVAVWADVALDAAGFSCGAWAAALAGGSAGAWVGAKRMRVIDGYMHHQKAVQTSSAHTKASYCSAEEVSLCRFCNKKVQQSGALCIDMPLAEQDSHNKHTQHTSGPRQL